MSLRNFKLYDTNNQFSERIPKIGDYITITLPPITHGQRIVNIPDTITGFVEDMDFEEKENGVQLLYEIELLHILYLNNYLNKSGTYHIQPIKISMQNDYKVSSSREIKKS